MHINCNIIDGIYYRIKAYYLATVWLSMLFFSCSFCSVLQTISFLTFGLTQFCIRILSKSLTSLSKCKDIRNCVFLLFVQCSCNFTSKLTILYRIHEACNFLSKHGPVFFFNVRAYRMAHDY